VNPRPFLVLVITNCFEVHSKRTPYFSTFFLQKHYPNSRSHVLQVLISVTKYTFTENVSNARVLAAAAATTTKTNKQKTTTTTKHTREI
jgi:hypothetical protein